mmetsp:Transcript_38094/g.75548  ORF Transcript_38094/g.75548 Transcript_38094/m.75548 type:complete len:565 (+) Transcript_38094:37-1731(+)
MFSSLFRAAPPREPEKKSPREPPRNQEANAKTSKLRDKLKGAALVPQKVHDKASKLRDKPKLAAPVQQEEVHSKPLKFKDQIKALEEALAKAQGGTQGVETAKKAKIKKQSGIHGVKAAKQAKVKTQGGVHEIKTAKTAMEKGDVSVPRESRAKKGTSWWAKKRAARREALAKGEEAAPAPNKKSKETRRKKTQLKDTAGDGAAADNDGGKAATSASPNANLTPRQLYKKNRWARLRAERKERKQNRKKHQHETGKDADDGSTSANSARKDVSKAKNRDKQQQSSTEGLSTKRKDEQQQQQQQPQHNISQSFLAKVNASAGRSKAAKAAEKLQGSRFRWLNEMLYTSSGADAKKAFDEDPSLATAYHEGFRAQCAKWPQNPLDDVIAWIRQEVPKGSVVGDFGCGEARLALELGKHYKTHSFDLIAINERIVACNLANVPLPDGSLDVVVFCLALMGTDWLDFIREARRCLKPGGLLHIAEVESRFDSIDPVVNNIQASGFRKVMYTPSSFFIQLRFARTVGVERPAKGSSAIPAKSQGGRKRKAKAGADQAAAGLRACKYRRR